MCYDFWIFLAKILNREVLWRGEFRCQKPTRLNLLTQMVLILQEEELGLFGPNQRPGGAGFLCAKNSKTIVYTPKVKPSLIYTPSARYQ